MTSPDRRLNAESGVALLLAVALNVGWAWGVVVGPDFEQPDGATWSWVLAAGVTVCVGLVLAVPPRTRDAGLAVVAGGVLSYPINLLIALFLVVLVIGS